MCFTWETTEAIISYQSMDYYAATLKNKGYDLYPT